MKKSPDSMARGTMDSIARVYPAQVAGAPERQSATTCV